MHLTNFIVSRTFYLYASCQVLKNDVILINHGSFFQEKNPLLFNRFQFSEMNKIEQFIYKNFVLEN